MILKNSRLFKIMICNCSKPGGFCAIAEIKEATKRLSSLFVALIVLASFTKAAASGRRHISIGGEQYES